MDLAQLRKYLIELPSKSEFRFDDKVKDDLDSTLKSALRLTDALLDPGKDNLYHIGRPCGRILRRGEMHYRCLTCGYDETTTFCYHCFDPQRHVGHQVYHSIVLRDGGSCDCGDPEAYKEFLCDYYTGLGAPDVFAGLDMEQFVKNIEECIVVLFDFIVDVVSHPSTRDVTTVDAVEDVSERCTLSAHVYGGSDPNSESYALLLYNDQVHQYLDAVQRVRRATGKTEDFAKMVVDHCQSQGRAIVMISTDIVLLLKRQLVLSATGLTTSIRSIRDVFRLSMVDQIAKFLNTLSKSVLVNNSDPVFNVMGKILMSSHIVGSQFATDKPTYTPYQDEFRPLSPVWRLDPTASAEVGYTDPSVGGVPNSRFQFLLYQDTRMPKETRVALHELFMSILVRNLRYKMMMTAQALDIYECVCSRGMLYDREPEFSVRPLLTTQVFTCPSTCTNIINHGDHYRIVRSIDTFIRQSEPHIVPALRNRRWALAVRDLGYIVTRNPDPRATEAMFDSLSYVVKLLSLLQSTTPLKREASNHVEYESTDYAAYFNADAALSRFPENLARVLNGFPRDRLPAVYSKLYGPFIDMIVSMNFMPGGDDHEDPVQFSQQHMPIFDVLTDRVSFLHPLHAALSWIIEAVGGDPGVLSVMDVAVRSKVPGMLPRDGCKVLLEIPLRTMVLLAQIKVGLWVRNGVTVRAQRNIYKHAGLRDHGFMRDLFLMQFICSHLPPDESMAQIVDRWGMVPWLHGEFSTPGYGSRAPEMAQALVLFLISLLNEDMRLYCLHVDKVSDMVLEREVIHMLCFRPLTYLQLVAEFPEHLLAEKRFFIAFEKCSEEAPGEQEPKTYQIKPELFDRVDPYYVHYTANKRDECIKLVQEHYHTKVITPRTIDWTDSPYAGIINLTCSPFFVAFIEQTIKFCIEQTEEGKELPDQLFSLVLHLLHIAMVQPNHAEFTKCVAPTSLTATLYSMLGNEKYMSVTPTVREIIKLLIGDLTPAQVQSMVPDYSAELVDSPLPNMKDSQVAIREKKKRLARRKREKVLARIKKQQLAFAAKHQDETEEDDMEMEVSPHESDKLWHYPEERCIFCQMPASSSDEPFGVFSYISSSNEFRKVPTESEYWFHKAFSCNELHGEHSTSSLKLQENLKKIEDEHIIGPGFPDSDSCRCETRSIVTSCGHGMHYSCYIGHIRGLRSHQISQLTRTVPANIAKGEFLCPLCRAVCNMFVPVCYNVNGAKFRPSPHTEISQLLSYTTPEFARELLAQLSGLQGSPRLALAQKELIASVQKRVKPGLWFIGEHGEVDASSKTFCAVNEAMDAMESLTLPFQGLSATIASTISSVEISLRGMDVSQVSTQDVTTLRVWSQFRDMVRAAESARLVSTGHNILSYPQRLLGLVANLCGEDSLLTDTESYFKMLVSIEPLESLGIDYHTLMGICYLRHVQQSLLQATALAETYSDDPLLSELADRKPESGNGLIYSLVSRLVAPFLRRVLIYTYVEYADFEVIETEEQSECDRITTMLGLPLLEDVLGQLGEPAKVPSNVLDMVPFPGPVNLVNLPERLCTLYTTFSESLELTKTEVPTEPSICLHCGAIVDMQKANYGDRYGSCNMHVQWECLNSDGWGIFLVPGNNCVLLLGNNRGTFIKGPYVDSYGERENDPKRSSELILSHKHYSELIRTIWLQHDIQNRIARQMENQVDIGGWMTL